MKCQIVWWCIKGKEYRVFKICNLEAICNQIKVDFNFISWVFKSTYVGHVTLLIGMLITLCWDRYQCGDTKDFTWPIMPEVPRSIDIPHCKGHKLPVDFWRYGNASFADFPHHHVTLQLNTSLFAEDKSYCWTLGFQEHFLHFGSCRMPLCSSNIIIRCKYENCCLPSAWKSNCYLPYHPI